MLWLSMCAYVQAEVSAIVAERQAERQLSQDRSFSNDNAGIRRNADSMSSGSLTPSRPSAPQVNQFQLVHHPHMQVLAFTSCNIDIF